jgi:hypothetical protein
MPREESRVRAANTHQATRQTHLSPLRQRLAKLSKWFLSVVSALVVLSGLLSYMPLISVDVGPPINVNDPFSYPYIVSNDSLLPLFYVDISCTFKGGEFAGGGGSFNNNSINVTNILAYMAPHQRTTAPCNLGYSISVPLQKGTVSIDLSYHSFVWPLRTVTSRSFQAVLTSENKTIWLPQ